MKKYFLILILGYINLCFVFPKEIHAIDDFFYWTDTNGVKHFTNRPTPTQRSTSPHMNAPKNLPKAKAVEKENAKKTDRDRKIPEKLSKKRQTYRQNQKQTTNEKEKEKEKEKPIPKKARFSCDRYHQKSSELAQQEGFAYQAQAVIYRHIELSCTECIGDQPEAALEYYQKAEAYAEKMNTCYQFPEMPEEIKNSKDISQETIDWYKTKQWLGSCVTDYFDKAEKMLRIGDSFMGCNEEVSEQMDFDIPVSE
ncbi:MAG: DUF4124 domain-containing protein [Desulfobacterales bacterium]|nr:DUF4124 domain-containing protein [Desulfobacterales bacterium]